MFETTNQIILDIANKRNCSWDKCGISPNFLDVFLISWDKYGAEKSSAIGI
jgi:hypothetical protein